MKTWVNIFTDSYDKKQLYVSKSYATKKEAKDNVRQSMKSRYINTVNLKSVLANDHRSWLKIYGLLKKESKQSAKV